MIKKRNQMEYGKRAILIHTEINFVKLCAILMTEEKISKGKAGSHDKKSALFKSQWKPSD